LDENVLNCTHVIDELKLASVIDADSESAISFCSLHFSELPESQHSDLGFDFISAIISHQGLQVLTEDLLYQFIKCSLSVNTEPSSLLQFVRFENLTTESLSDFLLLISNSFEILEFSVWSALIRRFSVFVCQKNFADCYYGRWFILRESFPLEGILLFFTDEYGGNFHE
jgi:hypothetical protein